MTRRSIVIGDGDEVYVEAFASYLMESLPGVEIYSYTSEEAFLASERQYQLGILSKDFLSVLEFSGKENVTEKFYLCDEAIAKEYEHLPMVYKYQSMEIVEEMLRRMQQRDMGSWWQTAGKTTQMIAIYSPISHELQLPFALALAEIYRESSSVLFLDIEENSILPALTNQQGKRGFVDLLYLLTRETDLPQMADFTNCFMGIDYISPFVAPEELTDITREMWISLMQYVQQSGYEKIVILFGRAVVGFSEILSGCQELIVLGKPGDYYRKSQHRFLEYAKSRVEQAHVTEVLLPMSAGNLVDGTYVIEELIQGNLGMFVRRALGQGGRKQELAYAVG